MKTNSEFKAHIRNVVAQPDIPSDDELELVPPSQWGTGKYAKQAQRTPRIVTKPVFPPIPTDACDWVAYYESASEPKNYGWGPTEEAAIEDLKANYSLEDSHEE